MRWGNPSHRSASRGTLPGLRHKELSVTTRTFTLDEVRDSVGGYVRTQELYGALPCGPFCPLDVPEVKLARWKLLMHVAFIRHDADASFQACVLFPTPPFDAAG